MRASCLVGDIAPAVAFAAGAAPDKAVIPILRNVLLTGENDTLSIEATDLDRRALSRASARVAEPGATTVNAAELAGWLRRHDERAEIALSTNDKGLLARIGSQSSLFLRTLPVADFPAPFTTDIITSFRLIEAEHRQLFKQTAPVIPAAEVRFQLRGLYLRCADRKLIAVASEGKRIVEASIDAPADLAEFSVIIPRDLVLAVAKMKGDIALRVGKKYVEIESGNRTLTSRLIDGVYLDYERAIPPISGNSIEVDRAALVDSLELVRAAIGQPAQTNKVNLPFASLTWTDSAGEVLVAAGDPEIGETVVPAIVRGNAHVSLPIGQLTPLLGAIDAERIVIDNAATTFAIRITKVGTSGFLALQSKVRP
jgi:DNA polymerase III subunit beta